MSGDGGLVVGALTGVALAGALSGLLVGALFKHPVVGALIGAALTTGSVVAWSTAQPVTIPPPNAAPAPAP